MIIANKLPAKLTTKMVTILDEEDESFAPTNSDRILGGVIRCDAPHGDPVHPHRNNNVAFFFTLL